MKKHQAISRHRSLKKRPRRLSKRFWRSLFTQLVERYRRKGGSDFDACKRLAPALSRAGQVHPHWSANYLVQVLHKSSLITPSPRFKLAVIDLYKARPRVRVDKLRICVPVENAAQRDHVNEILKAPGEKLNALLVAAHFEEE